MVVNWSRVGEMENKYIHSGDRNDRTCSDRIDEKGGGVRERGILTTPTRRYLPENQIWWWGYFWRWERWGRTRFEGAGGIKGLGM